MAKSHLQKQSLLQKALLDKKVLTQEVLMYQRLMEVMRNENSFEDILQLIITSLTKGLGYDRAGIFLADWDRKVVERVMGIDRYGKFEGKGSEYSPDPGKNGARLFKHHLWLRQGLLHQQCPPENQPGHLGKTLEKYRPGRRLQRDRADHGGQ